jgi:hypothetical protein
MAPRSNPLTPENRLADKVLVLAIATLVLLTPPVIAIFDLPVSVFGIPLLHAYTFAVWLGAIATGGAIARRLMRREAATPPPDSPPGA